MAYAEVYPDRLESEFDYEELDTLPIFADTTQDFYPNKDKAYEKIHGHSIWRDVVDIGTDTETAREYSTVTALPKNQLVDTPIVMTTAYLTSTHGHNEHTMLHLLDLGYPVVMIGPEGEAKSDKSLISRGKNLVGTSLPLSTQNVMEAIDTINTVHNSQSFQTFDDKNLIVLGESRGAMIGVGLPAYAQHYGRRIIYADLTAPCFPEKLDLSPRGAIEMIGQGISEFTSLKGLAKVLSQKRFLHYPSTLNLNPRYLAQALRAPVDLVSGDAGKIATCSAKLPYIPMHIKGFNDDVMCQFDNWKKIFGTHPEIAFKLVDGAHLTIAAQETLEHIENRLVALRDEIISHGNNLDEINFSNVHLTDRDNLGTLATGLTAVS